MTMLKYLALCLALIFAPIVVAMSAVTTQAAAQQPPEGPDYEVWERTATRAEEAISASRASTAAMEELRNQLADWREVFFAAQNINANAISTAQAQLDALGPAPEAGSEDAEIAAQRKQLSDQLAGLRAPRQRAEVAYSRADGMIKSIDRIIRERQANELMELGPSPLNPANWPEGVNALYSTFELLREEVAKALASDIQRSQTRKSLPLVVVLTIIGTILLFRGRYWIELLVRTILPRRATPMRWIVTLLVSMGEIVVPFIGFLLLVEALYASGLVGLRGEQLVGTIAPALLIFLVARWLALRCFPRTDLHRLPLQLNVPDRRAGRLYGGALGVIISVFYFFRNSAQMNNWSETATNVILFPVMILAALLLLRLARLLAKHSQTASENAEFDTYRNRLTRLLAKLLYALAFVAPLLAAIGYFKAATAMLMPSLLSLLLLAALLVVQRVITEVYVLLTGNREGAADELVPVLAGFAIVVLSAPLFALVWGARVADLSELWSQFTRGISLGGLKISPTIFLTLAVVFSVGLILTRLLQGTLKNTVLPKTRIDVGARTALVSGVGYIGIFLSAIIAITSAGIDLSSIALVAGALSVGIGFGLQNIVSNFVSGIILLIERPISQGDWIEVNGQHGTVREVSVRSTRIETFDRSDLIIPNADLVSGTVTNYTRGNTVGRVIVPVGVAYGNDTKRIETILREIAEAHPMVLANPAPSVLFRNFGADALEFEIRAILRDVNWVLSVQSDMNHEIARRFADEGIEVPFAQRDIWIRNPEALVPATPAAKALAEAAQRSESAESGTDAIRHVTEEDMGGDGDGDGGGR